MAQYVINVRLCIFVKPRYRIQRSKKKKEIEPGMQCMQCKCSQTSVQPFREIHIISYVDTKSIL